MDAALASVPPPDRGIPLCRVEGSICNLLLVVTGKPKGKGRPRFARRGNFVQTYTDDQTLSWEQNIGWQVKQQLAQLRTEHNNMLPLPFDKRVLASMTFYLDKPKSTPKKVQYPMKSRTDIDNYAKAVLDALQAVNVLKNDNIVTDLMAAKRYTEPPHVEGVEIDLTGWL